MVYKQSEVTKNTSVRLLSGSCMEAGYIVPFDRIIGQRELMASDSIGVDGHIAEREAARRAAHATTISVELEQS